MPVYTIGKTKIPYEIHRSSEILRRYIEVTPDRVLVTVQDNDKDIDITEFLRRKERWLFEHTQRLKGKTKDTAKVSRYLSGAKILYRGRHMKLNVSRTSDTQICIEYKNGFFIALPDYVTSDIQDDTIEQELRLWMKHKLRKDVREYIKHYEKLSRLKPKAIHIKEQKHMWGSCGKDGSINLNWHLVGAPKPILEYAVWHEMCHLKHRTHDRAFWSYLKKFMPDYQERKEWLEQHGATLNVSLVEGGTSSNPN